MAGRLAGLPWRGRARGDAIAWAVTLLVVVLFLLDAGRRIEQADDAFISYRYALNLVRGHGLVFNPGEYVEGFTNLLWTLLIALFVWLGAQAPSVAQAMSLLFGSLSLVFVHVYVRRFLPRRLAWLAAASPVVLLASNSFACWMTTGLETPLFLFLTIAGLLTSDMQRRRSTAIISVLAFLCRPEGGIMAGTLLGVPWIIQMARGPIRWRRLMIVSEPPMLFAGAVVAVTAWRMYYYGDFVPNTFHAKVGQVPASAGWTYLEKFLSDGPLLLLPPVLFGLVVQPRLRLPALFVLATTTYTVSIGGDVFAFGRFLLPVLPVLLAAASAAITWTIERNMAAGISLALILPATAAVSVAGRVAPPFIPFASDFDWAHLPPSETVFSGKRMVAERHWFFIDEKRHVRMLAAKVREAKPGARLIACIGIGKFGYYNMDFIILDMVGLTDRHIAQSERMVPGTWLLPGHSRTDSDYVLSRKPDVILLPGMDGLHPGQLPAVEDMLANPKLQQEYVYHEGSIWVRK